MSPTRAERTFTALDALYEFERAPVSTDKLQPGRYFAGLFAGEHIAATEFVIGTTFVAWGVRAYDVFVGLLIGNVLAVLTWTLICVPIAVQTRLTLYWYLRKIAGPVTTALNNVLNAVLFCILAGCMITISASAVRIPFGIPAQVHWYPRDLRFVLVVLGVGTVVVTLAVLGFKKLAQFASVCSPWLVLMFISGAVAALPGLARAAGLSQITGLGDLWTIANKMIWTGKVEQAAGKPPMSFWQVAAFAWICNLATHAGLSDMALFRYARRAGYGLYSAFGMILGHYLAWICAGVMGAAAAVALQTNLAELDSGGVARQVLGLCGIIAVVIAGWTTANPTLYRAGLAFQAVTPHWPRWLVTLMAGAATSVIACFPFVFTRLLDFIGYYGLLLMPVGAIVFTEHWVFPKIGLTRYWVAQRKLLVSWPAMLSWAVAVAVAIALERSGTLHLFYLFVPIWLLTMALYIVLAWLAGAGASGAAAAPSFNAERDHQGAPDNTSRQRAEVISAGRPHVLHYVFGLIAVLALLACLVLSIRVFCGGLEDYDRNFAAFKKWLIWPTLVYFVSGTAWAARKNKVK